jgi:carboxyl-terminal processing protease
MRPTPSSTLTRVAAMFAVLIGSATFAADAPPAEPPDRAAVARQVRAITDAVLEQGVRSPARQQMILCGIQSLYREAGSPEPEGLATRVSSLAAPEELAALPAAIWPEAPREGVSPEALERALLEGLLEPVPGGSLVSAKEARVAEQFRGNRYVGLQIALSYDAKAKRPVIKTVLRGGPADRAGIRDDEILEAIDGEDTEGRGLEAAVDRLRGAEGTVVEIRVRRRPDDEARTLRITREALPRETISGFEHGLREGGAVCLPGPGPIGYLKIGEIVASTPRELRQAAGRLEAEGARGLILDLRSLGEADLHPTILLADLLLDGGSIGRVRSKGRAVDYRAEPGALFRGLPMVVLIGALTSGPAEWLAAAVQDNRRGVLVGERTRGQALVSSTVPVDHGTWWITLPTDVLERADGQAIAPPAGSYRGQSEGPLPFLRRPGVPEKPEGGVIPDREVREGRGGPGRAPGRGEADPAMEVAKKIVLERLQPSASVQP